MRKRIVASLCVLGLAVAGGVWFFVASREEPTAIVVRDEEKRPVAGVEIKLDRVSVWTDSFEEPSFVGVTDADGRLELPLEPEDAVLVAKPGFATHMFRIGRKRTTKVELTRSATLRGRVVSASTGAPIGDARVELVRYGGSEPSLFATSGVDGHVTIEAIDPTLATHFVVQVRGCIPHQAELELREPRAYDHEFVIADAPRLRGRVIDLVTNELLTDAEIVPLGMGGDIAYRAATTTDSTGAFELRGDLEAWSGVGFEARKEGFASTRRELDDEDTDWSGTTELVLGVVRECVVEGTVTDERGEPVVGATCLGSQDGMGMKPLPVEIPSGVVFDHYGAKAVASDAAGGYRLGGLLPWLEPASVFVARRETSCSVRGVALDEPGSSQHIDWVLPIADTEVEGRVRVNGVVEPCRLSWVARRETFALGNVNHQETSSTGAYRFDGVASGVVTVQVDLGRGFAPRRQDTQVQLGRTNVVDFDIDVDRSRIAGHVTAERLVRLRTRKKWFRPRMERVELDLSGIRVRATRVGDGAVAEAIAGTEGQFEISVPSDCPDEWNVIVVEANATTKLSSKDTPELVHAGADAVRLFVEPLDP